MKLIKELMSILSWARLTFRDPYYEDIQAYLNDSTSLADLEQRMNRLKYRGMVL